MVTSGGSAAGNTGFVQLPCTGAASQAWRLPGYAGGTGTPTTPPMKTVRVYWLKPSDAASTDGTPISASFYDYPDTHFNQAQKTAILNGRYGSFLS